MEEKHFLMWQMTVYHCAADVRTFIENLNARKLSKVDISSGIIFREYSKYLNALVIENFYQSVMRVA